MTGLRPRTIVIGVVLFGAAALFYLHYRRTHGLERWFSERLSKQRFLVPVGDSPALGDPLALVTVVEFADFYCGYCARSAVVRQRLFDRYGTRLRWVYKHFSAETEVARAAAAAGEAFWRYSDALYRRRRFDESSLLKLAAELGLDVQRFRRDWQSEAIRKRVAEDAALAKRLGIRGTPHFFINGRPVRGAYPLRFLARVIDDELGRAHRALKHGVQREQLYTHLSGSAADRSDVR